MCICVLELAREEDGQPVHRGGAITPDGLIEEDYEQELGAASGSQVAELGAAAWVTGTGS